MKFCVKCGNQLEENTNFCSSCGASQETQGTQATPPPQQPNYNQQNQYNQYNQQNQSQSPPGKNMAIISLVLGIIAITGSGMGYGIPLAIVGLILGIMGKKQLDAAGEPSGIALGGIIMCGIVTGLSIILTITCFACGGCTICAAACDSMRY